LPIKLDTWCWTKFATCSKLWNKACTGFSDMLYLRFDLETTLEEKIRIKSIYHSQQSSPNNRYEIKHSNKPYELYTRKWLHVNAPNNLTSNHPKHLVSKNSLLTLN
jgi:hypothetical protein